MFRRAVTLATLLVCSLGFIGAVRAQTTNVSKAEQEVRALERRWLDAYEQTDPAAMDAIVADDFIITFPNGSMQSKPQLMNMIRGMKAAAMPRTKFYTEDVRSRAYGDTVILMGRVVTEYEREGKTVKEQSRYTDTYVRLNGKWRVVASHLSNVAEPKKPAAEK
ncbi:MAG TPA: nuclear transport factor 2 family protein [Pyrinomonadaceae bacterium]|nr:nuclear transport factor 2 family protein [Pyrinomonadaceae bacterium]